MLLGVRQRALDAGNQRLLEAAILFLDMAVHDMLLECPGAGTGTGTGTGTGLDSKVMGDGREERKAMSIGLAVDLRCGSCASVIRPSLELIALIALTGIDIGNTFPSN